MLKKTITYTDYDGNQRTEDFYFNLSKAEIVEMQNSRSGGLDKALKTIVVSGDRAQIIKAFKDLILKSYGEKSPDGRRFVKSKELSIAFSQTEAYTELFMELASDAQAGSDFVNGITPKVAEKTPAIAPIPVPNSGVAQSAT